MNKNEIFKKVCIGYAVFYAILIKFFVGSSHLPRTDITDVLQIWVTDIVPPALILSFIRFFTVNKWIFPFIADKLVISSKYQFGVRKRRISLVAKQLFKCILYISLHCYCGTNALKKVDWVPSTFLIGTTDESTQSIFQRLVYDSNALDHLNLPQDVQRYFNLLTAYHLHEAGWLFLFSIGDYNFWEMLLHHVVTLSLIVLCFITKHTALGSLVMILHGLTDIPVAFAKIFSNTSLGTVTFIAYLSMLVSWLYYRVFVFIGSVIYPIYIVDRKARAETGTFGEPTCYWILLSTLAFLHIFWIGLFFKMGYRYITKGKAHDSTAVRSSDSEETESVGESSMESATINPTNIRVS